MLQHLAASLPGEGPRGDDGDLGDEEYGTGDDRLAEVDAHAHRRRDVLALNEHRVPGRRAGVRRLAVVLESKLVRDLNGLHQEKILAVVGRGVGGAATATFAEGNDGTELACGFLLIALHRLASGHAGCHQRAELYHLRARELERVEVREQNLK